MFCKKGPGLTMIQGFNMLWNGCTGKYHGKEIDVGMQSRGSHEMVISTWLVFMLEHPACRCSDLKPLTRAGGPRAMYWGLFQVRTSMRGVLIRKLLYQLDIRLQVVQILVLPIKRASSKSPPAKDQNNNNETKWIKRFQFFNIKRTSLQQLNKGGEKNNGCFRPLKTMKRSDERDDARGVAFPAICTLPHVCFFKKIHSREM